MTQTKQAKHTAGKWHVDTEKEICIATQCELTEADIGTEREWTCIGLRDEDGMSAIIALCDPDNARHIVKCVNSHEELLEALQMCQAEFATLRARLSGSYARNAQLCIEAATQAISKARGEE